MHGIPVEIIRQIFHEAVLQARPVESTRVPIYISHVCRHWREISLSHGNLWASLSISYDGSGGDRKRTVLIELFDTFLRRTGGSALDFSVSFELCCEEKREAHYVAEHIVKKLISQQRRWRDVAFVWRFTAFSNFTDMEVSRSEMPMLRSLVLDADIHYVGGRLVRPYINISRSPRLQEIRLAGKYSIICGDQPISALTEDIILDFKGKWDEWRGEKICLDLLKVAPRSTTLHARFHSDTVFSESEHAERDKLDEIIHSLKRLRLEYAKNLPPSLLSKLILPSLEDLFFEVDKYQSAGEDLLMFIQRSLPPLLNLELRGKGGNEVSLIKILRLLPTLRNLTLYSTRMSAELFEELACNGEANASSTFDRRVTCPSLKRLEITFPYVYPPVVIPACAHAFCSMVESRWKHLKSFEMVTIDEERTDVCSIRRFQKTLEHCFDREEFEDGILVGSTS